MNKDILLNISKLHTTERGILRIKNNLGLDNCDVCLFCKNKILDKKCNIYRKGKNWYCVLDGITIGVNASSYTIMTAHKYEKGMI